MHQLLISNHLERQTLDNGKICHDCELNCCKPFPLLFNLKVPKSLSWIKEETIGFYLQATVNVAGLPLHYSRGKGKQINVTLIWNVMDNRVHLFMFAVGVYETIKFVTCSVTEHLALGQTETTYVSLFQDLFT